ALVVTHGISTTVRCCNTPAAVADCTCGKYSSAGGGSALLQSFDNLQAINDHFADQFDFDRPCEHALDDTDAHVARPSSEPGVDWAGVGGVCRPVCNHSAINRSYASRLSSVPNRPR